MIVHLRPLPAYTLTNLQHMTESSKSCAEEGDLRLADGLTAEDGSSQYGRLEMFSGGCGTVCNFEGQDPALPSFERRRGEVIYFTETSALVACRQLGFSDGVSAGPATELFPLGVKPVPPSPTTGCDSAHTPGVHFKHCTNTLVGGQSLPCFGTLHNLPHLRAHSAAPPQCATLSMKTGITLHNHA